mmetsp:Transcript_68115/g.121375  ORF Transcript_68115/g.121375 Transcript_68115/m.121375 type:complete len:232 (+) Transcript_68115:300-995(+)
MNWKSPRLMPEKFTEPSGTSHMPPRLQICKLPFNVSPMFLSDTLYSFAFILSSSACFLASIFCCLASSFAFCFNAARSAGGRDLMYLSTAASYSSMSRACCSTSCFAFPSKSFLSLTGITFHMSLACSKRSLSSPTKTDHLCLQKIAKADGGDFGFSGSGRTLLDMVLERGWLLVLPCAPFACFAGVWHDSSACNERLLLVWLELSKLASVAAAACVPWDGRGMSDIGEMR